MIYKCKNCGAAIEYDAESGKMVCEHCGSTFVPGDDNEILGKSEINDTMEQKIYCCSACGAELMINDVEAATFCAFCGQPTIVFNRVSRVKKPDLILPFSITKEQAREAINNKMKGFFVPKAFRDIKPDLVRGIYIPYAFSDVEFKNRLIIRGEVHRGKNSVTKYYYRNISGKLEALPIDLSKKFDDNSAMRLEPFKGEFEEFDPSYLSGFYADCRDETNNSLENKRDFRAKSIIRDRAIFTVSATNKEVIREDPKLKIDNVRYGLMPVWYFNGEESGKRFTIMVNGSTGEVVGAAPPNKFRMYLMGIPIFLVLLFAMGVICGMMASVMFFDVRGLVIPFLIGVFIWIAYTKYADKKYAYGQSCALTQKEATYKLVKERQEV